MNRCSSSPHVQLLADSKNPAVLLSDKEFGKKCRYFNVFDNFTNLTTNMPLFQFSLNVLPKS